MPANQELRFVSLLYRSLYLAAVLLRIKLAPSLMLSLSLMLFKANLILESQIFGSFIQRPHPTVSTVPSLYYRLAQGL